MHRKHAIIAAAMIAIPASAQPLPHWYGGIGAGQSRTSDDLVGQRESNIVNGEATSSSFDANDGAGRSRRRGVRASRRICVDCHAEDVALRAEHVLLEARLALRIHGEHRRRTRPVIGRR